MSELSEHFKLYSTSEFEKATVVLSLICVSAVIGLFAYLSRTTGRPHFKLWAVAFVIYALYLAGLIAFEMVPHGMLEEIVLSSAIGVSALFMFWGDFELAEQPRPNRDLTLAIMLLLAWCCGSVYWVRDSFWLVMPVFLLLGIARALAAFFYFRYRDRNRGTNLLVIAFLLWGLHALLLPFLQTLTWAQAVGHLSSSIFAVMIAIGMIVEEECKDSEEKYRGVLDASSAAVFLIDLWSLRILDVNKAAQQLTKRSRQDLLSGGILDLCPDLRKAGDNQLDHRAMFNAVFKPFNEFHMVRSDGALVLCEGDTHLTQWHRHPVLQISVREVEKDKKIGQLVRRAEKLSSLGQLVAGVAHELNNPLAVVVGYAQIMAKQRCGDEGTRRNIVKILHESERAAKIVRDLLSFARPCEPQMSVVDVNHLVSNVLEIRDGDLRSRNILVDKRLAPGLPNTKADPIQIEQVLTNLITNAIHAMTTQAGPRKLTVETEENGFFVRITVADNGPGIPNEILARIFDPFFTTKPAGQGTGLGLSISNSIMQEHRGKIWVQSEFGQGAKFYVELPIVPCETAVAATRPSTDGATAPAQPTDQRLLIVDDEPGICDVLREVLTATGYTVETASTGTEAVDRISCCKFDLIISDLCMPEMGGEELYQTVYESNPQLAQRMIFVTGDTVSPQSRTFLEQTGNRWLTKPFNIADVEQTVRTLLNQDPLKLLTGEGNHLKKPVAKYHPSRS